MRRWTRGKKLTSTIHSRKEGFRIDESNLVCFLKSSPKYRSFGFMIETGIKLEHGEGASIGQALVDHIGYLEKQLEEKQAEVKKLQAELGKVKGMSIYLDSLRDHY